VQNCISLALAETTDLQGVQMVNLLITTAGIFLLSVTLLPNIVSANTDGDWEYGLSSNGWFPDSSGNTLFPIDGGGDFTIPISDILDNLEFTFKGIV
jgi:hypothetical protein